MKKEIITRKECNRLFTIINSSDGENEYIALKLINESDIIESLGFIILLYKFSKIDNLTWEYDCPNVWKKLNEIQLINEDEEIVTPTSSEVLKTMIAYDCDIDAIAEFLVLHSETLVKTLKVWGYPTELLNINITLKQNTNDDKVRITS